MRHTLETARNSTGSTNTVSDHEKIADEFCEDCIKEINDRLRRMKKLPNLEEILSNGSFNQMCGDLAGICHIAKNIVDMDAFTKASKLSQNPYPVAAKEAVKLRGEAYKIYAEMQPFYPVGPLR
jgi:hypothetical protein